MSLTRAQGPYHGETWGWTGTGCLLRRYHRSMDDLKARLADAEAKLSHVKEYL